jgi:hypothetical protein
MKTKNLMSQAVRHLDPFTREYLTTNLVELSERDLQHINGGIAPRSCSCGRSTIGCTDGPGLGLPGGCSCQLSQANDILSLTASEKFNFIIG